MHSFYVDLYHISSVGYHFPNQFHCNYHNSSVFSASLNGQIVCHVVLLNPNSFSEPQYSQVSRRSWRSVESRGRRSATVKECSLLALTSNAWNCLETQSWIEICFWIRNVSSHDLYMPECWIQLYFNLLYSLSIQLVLLAVGMGDNIPKQYYCQLYKMLVVLPWSMLLR